MTTFPTMDPEIAAATVDLPELDIADVAAAREVNSRLSAPGLAALTYDGVDVREVTAPGLGDDPNVPIRLLCPTGVADPLPTLVAIHGGGFVLGTAHEYDYFCLEVVRQLGIAVANVEYRLAPETSFPGPLDDCYAALTYLHAEGPELGLDPSRIAIGGTSAGGCLAAGTALRARDEGGPPIVFQYLVSPAVDDRLHTQSVTQFVDAPVLNSRLAGIAWRHYLGENYTGPDDPGVSSYAAPARATDLSGLPPAYVVAMELDPLRDDDILYALRLLRAGVSVELHSYPGTVHGAMELAAGAEVSIRAQRQLLDAIRRGLRLGSATT